MTKRANATAQQSKVKVNKNNQNGGIRILRVKKGDSLKKIYAKYRKAFTAADLQKYAEIEEGIPFEEIIAEIDLAQREWEEKKKKQYKK
jgi:hypothetical protein